MARDALAEISRGELAPVYVLVSEEPLLLERTLRALRDRAVPEKLRAFNHDVLEGRGATAQGIVNAARTLPMMGKARLVEVRGADAVPAAELAELLPYLEDPSPDAIVVLAFERLDKRLKFSARAKKLGYLSELAVPKKIEDWLEREASERRVALEPRARARLVEAVGRDLSRLSLSLEQLSLYAGDRAVSVSDVEDLVAETRERTVFELIDAAFAGDAAAALAGVGALFDQRQSPIGVVVMLGRHLRQLAHCHALQAERAPKSEAAKRLGVPPFVVDKLYAQARRVSPAAVARGIARASETDRGLKGQSPAMKTLGRGLGERILVEELVTDLLELQTSPTPARAARGGR